MFQSDMRRSCKSPCRGGTIRKYISEGPQKRDPKKRGNLPSGNSENLPYDNLGDNSFERLHILYGLRFETSANKVFP